MKKGFVLLLIFGLGYVGVVTAVASLTRSSAGVTPTLSLALVEDGFSQPTDIANGGNDRLFVAERAGYIHVIDNNQITLTPPFLDIENRVNSESHSERGLLGLVFHPNYPATPYFYVNYINEDGNTTIARYTANDSNNQADPNSEVILLTINQPAANHNAGDLNFGADGYLYIATGDGGSAGDPWGDKGNGQETQSLLGKILRIDVDQGSPYAIPADNPFVNDPNTRDEIWALGLRNPWRFSFDRQTNDLYIADVGQYTWEEINFTAASGGGGENYGWRCYEGNQPFNTSNCAPSSSYVFPIDDYPHDNPSNDLDEGSSITGGFVYRGMAHPDLQGIYLYGDFVSGNIWLAIPGGGNSWTIIANGPITNLNNISTFGEGCSGELYVADYGGKIFQIRTSVVAPPPVVGPIKLYLPLVFQDVSNVNNTCTPFYVN